MALQQIANTDISSTGTFALGSISSSTLTSGRVTYATTGGLLTDSSSLTYDGTTLTSTKFAGALNGTVGATTPSTVVATSVTNSGLTSGRITFATTSGLLTDSSTLTYDAVTLTTPRLALGGTTLPSAGTATLFLRSSDNSTYLQTGSGNNIYFLDGSQNTMLSLTPSSLAFQISNAAKLTLNSTTLHTANGISVGIGTDSPYGLLNIKGSNGQLVLANGNTSGGMKLTASNSIYTGNGYLAFEGYSNEYGRFDSSGNFGIGATSLAANFHISKSTTATVMISNISTSLVTDDAMGLIDFSAGSSNTVNARISGLVVGTSEAGGSLAVETRTDGGSLTEKFRITGAGNVGIGTGGPAAALGILATGMNNQIVLGVNPSNANYGSISLNGNNADSARIGMTGGGSGDNTLYIDVPATTGAYAFRQGVTNVITVNSSGNVGIGQTSPAARLDVTTSTAGFAAILTNTNGASDSNGLNIRSGTVSTEYNLRLSNTSNTADFMVVKGSGNVGIGTSSPDSFTTFPSKLVVGSGTGGQHITIYSGTASEGDIVFADGTTGADQYRGTFRYDHADDTMKFYTGGGTFGMSIVSGKVGINELIPYSPLSVTQTRQGNAVDKGALLLMTTATTGGDRLNLNFSMNGIGGRARAAVGAVSNDTGGYNCSLAFYARDAGDGSELQTTDEKMRIDSDGRLLLGTTSPLNSAYRMSLKVNSATGGLVIQPGADNYTALAFFNAAGTTCGTITVSPSATAYNTSSDYRLKEDIAPMTGALAKVAQLKPVTYKWKEDGSDGQGFIAHELAEVVPQCVDGEKDAVHKDGKPKYQGVDTSFLVATLVKAIQEQQALIESMATKLKDAGVAGF